MKRKDLKRRVAMCDRCGELVRANHTPRCSRYRARRELRRRLVPMTLLGIAAFLLTFAGVIR